MRPRRSGFLLGKMEGAAEFRGTEDKLNPWKVVVHISLGGRGWGLCFLESSAQGHRGLRQRRRWG